MPELCNICMSTRYYFIKLRHMNENGDVSGHKVCIKCYKTLMPLYECPFCRSELITSNILNRIYKVDINVWFICVIFIAAIIIVIYGLIKMT